MTTPRLEFIGNGSRKFWQAIDIVDTDTGKPIDAIVRFGRIGENPGRWACQGSDIDRVYERKLRKGYRAVERTN